MTDIIEKFYKKHYNNYAFLKALYFRREFVSEEFIDQLELHLTDYPYQEGDEIFKIIFNGIKDIKIGDINHIYRLVLTITDVSHDQLEGIRYRVSETEDEILSFYCNSIELL